MIYGVLLLSERSERRVMPTHGDEVQFEAGATLSNCGVDLERSLNN